MAGLLDYAQLFDPQSPYYNGENIPGLLSFLRGEGSTPQMRGGMPQGAPGGPQGGMLPQSGMDVPMPRPRPFEAPQMQPQQPPQMPGADAMAQAAPQQAQQPNAQQLQQPQSPSLLQRLANSDGVIGGVANFIGGITGQAQRGINPETSQGPAGQAYRLMLSKGVDPATAKLMATSKEMATAWMAKNVANDQYQPIPGPDGNPIAQKNLSTGKVESDPRADDPAISQVKYAAQNWRQLGFPDPQSADPKDRNFWKEYNAKRLGGAGVNVSIDQSAPNEFEKHYGEGMGKRALDVISQGDAATQDLQTSKLSRAFLSKIQTGKLAGTQATVGAWAKAIGIDPKTLGIDENLPAISQAAQSAIAQQTVSMIGNGGFPANNFSDADRKFLQSIPANIGNTPEANELLADVKERVAQRKIDRANAWADAREAGQSYEKFESAWRKVVAKEDLFADVRSKVDGMRGGVISNSPLIDELVKKHTK